VLCQDEEPRRCASSAGLRDRLGSKCSVDVKRKIIRKRSGACFKVA